MEFVYRRLNQDDINAVLKLQDEVIASLEDKSQLRKNDKPMFEQCLNNTNYSLGAFDNQQLIGLAILFIPEDENEDLAHCLINVDYKGYQCANYKLAMISKDYRGNGLQLKMALMLEKYAKENGYNLLCVTVADDNIYSKRNIEKAGYIHNCSIVKYGGLKRELYYKILK